MKYFDFAAELRNSGRSKRTCDEYYRRFRSFMAFMFKEYKIYDVMEVTPEHVLAYKNLLICSNASRNTINGKLNAVSLFYDMAVAKHSINNNPCQKGLLLAEEIAKIRDITKAELASITKWASNLESDYRDAINCMLATGARPGELTKLKGTDVLQIDGNVFLSIYNHNWDCNKMVPVMDRKIAAIIFMRSLSAEDELLFGMTKRQLIKSVSRVEEVYKDFHYHLFRYTQMMRLKRKKIPSEIINYLFGEEDNLPKRFKKLDDLKHCNEVLKYNDKLFDEE